MTEEEKLIDSLKDLTDISVVGMYEHDDILEIYATAKRIKTIDCIKTEFTIENNYL